MQQYIIIVAGGHGSRMKSDIPKQYLEVKGVPIIIRAIRCFLNYKADIKIIVCVHPSYKLHLEGLIKTFHLSEFSIQITNGGDTRFQSVKNGLLLADEEPAVVGIHDAARPFVSLTTIEQCFDTARIKGNAVPCLPVNESLRKISNNINQSVNRNEYKVIQTPQCFALSKIKKAFEQDYNSGFTDDATVLESTGESIHLVEGNPENIKITSPFDLIIAEALAEKA
ncbi:MAG: 2-C-methyl-D-erythritol 4-phosphate cytidylyltransferase [Bacteroidia bacterium]|nr:2-C-methyl-D-erythritol 4-phosphate cytidylyltransferase [Bacteroidia bacterium]